MGGANTHKGCKIQMPTKCHLVDLLVANVCIAAFIS